MGILPVFDDLRAFRPAPQEIFEYFFNWKSLKPLSFTLTGYSCKGVGVYLS
jgi:hypothetical protein